MSVFVEKPRFRAFDPANTPDREALGTAVKVLRQLLGISQNALAERAGMSQSAISKFEKGQTDSIDNLTALAKGLNLDPMEIWVLANELRDPHGKAARVGVAAVDRLIDALKSVPTGKDDGLPAWESREPQG